jgi:hypothetical protein
VSIDVRGWRIALLADALLNPEPRASMPDVLKILEASSYGVLQLPPARGAHGLLLTVTADQVAEYAHHGYAVVAVGLKGTVESGLHWRRLTSLLQERNTALPQRHVIASETNSEKEAARLASFLASYDVADSEKARWRV